MDKEKTLLLNGNSGLLNVYLADGYDVVQTEHGEAVSIHNLAGLHKVIGLDIVQKSSAFTGDEIQFLRKEMNLTQNSFADILSVSEDTVLTGKTSEPILLARQTNLSEYFITSILMILMTYARQLKASHKLTAKKRK